jgi:hypothetical protein
MESGQPGRTAYSAARYKAAHQILEDGAKLGEPWLTYFEPDEIAAELTGRGFRKITDLGPAGMAARYFGRTDVPPETPGSHVLHAVR